MNKIFEVEKGRVISSVKYGRDFHEGEVIDLSFATDEDCQALLNSGAVKATTRKPTALSKLEDQSVEKAEVKDG